MKLFERAAELTQETIEHRRWFHKTAEVGLHMPKAVAYVKENLAAWGLEPKECGAGVTATLGSGGKTLLLRADMDALPMAEESGLEFACTEGRAHACGHDFHAAMLLTAAKLLKEREDELHGTVRFMFQPAEETFDGAQNMIEHGILEPKPDAAMAFHVTAGQMPTGMVFYNDTTDAMMFSVDVFELTVHGRGSHGAYPHYSVDPINIGAHIHLALQTLIARECNPTKAAVLTIGQFTAGSAPNIIPETAVLKGTIRSNDPQERALLTRRLQEVCEGTAALFGGTVDLHWINNLPPLMCKPELVKDMVGYIEQIPGISCHPGASASASEDFALISEQIPSVFLYLSAGFTDERGCASAHNPKVQFNEDALIQGATALAHCALSWLQNN